MTSQLRSAGQQLWPIIPVLLPFGLWAMLWLGVSPGFHSGILRPGDPVDFVQGLRAFLPFTAAFLAALTISNKIYRRRPPGFRFFSPLGLAFIYGLVGLVAVSQSPNGPVALRWASLYIIVPLVLWAVVWDANPLRQLPRIINGTWVAISLVSLGLFATALFYLDFGDILLDPSRWLDCSSGNWFDLTSGRLRDTGVGRYAAIAAIVAISGVWQGKWRGIWTLILLSSVALLFYSGARGAIAGFAVGAGLAVLLYGGRRALFAGVIATVLLVPILWATGAHDTFLDNCIFRNRTIVPEAPPPALSATPVNEAPDPTLQPSSGGPASTALQPSSVGPASTPAATPQAGEAPAPTPQAPPNTVANPGETTASSANKSKREVGEFFQFTGRSAVWRESLKLVKESPAIGYGFHADRFLLKTHTHNAVIHSLLQTGVIGTIPFVAAFLFGWFSLARIARRLNHIPAVHKHLVIQSGAILGFLTIRAFPESTGAFFGIDWLILAPILLYLHQVNSIHSTPPSPPETQPGQSN